MLCSCEGEGLYFPTGLKARAKRDKKKITYVFICWLDQHPIVMQVRNIYRLTSTRLLVQQVVTGGALALKTDWSVHADVGASAVIDHALIQPCKNKPSLNIFSSTF